MVSRLPLTARRTLDMVDRELKQSGNDDDSCRGNCGLRLSSQRSSGRTSGRPSLRPTMPRYGACNVTGVKVTASNLAPRVVPR
jgi:hypothetical protein